MTEDLVQSLNATKCRWKKTLGERVIRVIGIGLALISVVVGAKYSLDSRLIIEEPAPYRIERTGASIGLGQVPLILPQGREPDDARVHVLREAIESYFGAQVITAPADGAVEFLTDATSLVLVYGDKVYEDSAAMDSLMGRVVDREIPVVWLGAGFAGYAEELGFGTFSEAERKTLPTGSKLVYRDTEVPAEGLEFVDGEFEEAGHQAQQAVSVRLHEAISLPAALKSPLGVFIRFTPFSAQRTSYALPIVLDLVSQFLGRHPRDPRVVFRVEDVNAVAYGPGDTSFAEAAAYLESEGVPLHLAVIPVMVNAQGKVLADIGDADPVLDYVAGHRREVAIAQHGTLHFREHPRNEGLGSGDAYEFFFDDDQTMGEQAAREFARKRLERGYRVMARAGIEPTMFEAPHLEMSPGQEAVALDMYPIMLHQPMFFGGGNELMSLMLPWLTERQGAVYAPSDAGYVAGTDTTSVDRIMAKLEMLKGIIPDPIVVVFYHPFLLDREGRREEMERLVQGIKALKYRFVNLLEEVEPVSPDEQS